MSSLPRYVIFTLEVDMPALPPPPSKALSLPPPMNESQPSPLVISYVTEAKDEGEIIQQNRDKCFSIS